MTTEEKAKAYDEALNIAKETHETQPVYRAWLEKMFPELRESEDERIRGRLIQVVSAISGGWSFETYGITKKEAINYLEKQKEPNPAMIQWTGNNLKEVIDFTGKSPRFGEWFKSWEDYENYVHSHGDIFKLFCEDGSHYEVPVGAWIVKTPDGYNIPSRFRFIQKPVEWSEEDERYINGLIGLIKDMKVGISPKLRGVAADRCIAFLKSLRPQPHWKPSEQEKGALRTAIHVLTEQINFPKTAANLQAILDVFDGKESRKDWKPSEEQMNCLCASVDAAIRKHNESVSGYEPARVLKSLYEQLKKLM